MASAGTPLHRLHWSLSRCLSLSDALSESYLLTCPVSFLKATHTDLSYCWHDSSEVYLLPNLQPFLLRSWFHAGKAKKKGGFSAHVPTLARVAQWREHSNIKQMWPGLRSRRRHHLRGFLQVVFFFFCPQKLTAGKHSKGVDGQNRRVFAYSYHFHSISLFLKKTLNIDRA